MLLSFLSFDVLVLCFATLGLYTALSWWIAPAEALPPKHRKDPLPSNDTPPTPTCTPATPATPTTPQPTLIKRLRPRAASHSPQSHYIPALTEPPCLSPSLSVSTISSSCSEDDLAPLPSALPRASSSRVGLLIRRFESNQPAPAHPLGAVKLGHRSFEFQPVVSSWEKRIQTRPLPTPMPSYSTPMPRSTYQE
ncbi:hypothetical protein DM01DRAFT_1409589 [Hesseltinella vesiculosa]|uniref:Uncharacterized protein n=1 Tax=Hesseltinella vesiculosa TaxID=101127 RepID=A0A1X2GAH0_9FUNG|nr:hypothetical protein DM01DRAFT_1409589 [Hesseltinella vesiculosa]